MPARRLRLISEGSIAQTDAVVVVTVADADFVVGISQPGADFLQRYRQQCTAQVGA